MKRFAISVSILPATVMTLEGAFAAPNTTPRESLSFDFSNLNPRTIHAFQHQQLYNILLDNMCAPGFSEDKDFTGWFTPGGPGMLRYQCEHNVGLKCSDNYQPLGTLQTHDRNMSYNCFRTAGGPAAAKPVCGLDFNVENESDNNYTCEALVPRRCFQQHWRATSLDATGYHVTYLCWGRSL